MEEVDSNRAKVTEPFPAGQDGVPCPTPSRGPNRLQDPRRGRGARGVWEPVKEAELSSPPARSSLTRPALGRGLRSTTSPRRPRGAGGEGAARLGPGVTSPPSPLPQPLAASGRLSARGLTGVVVPTPGGPSGGCGRADSSSQRAPRAGGDDWRRAGRARPEGAELEAEVRRGGGGEGEGGGAHTPPPPAAPSPSPDVNWDPFPLVSAILDSNSGQRRRRKPGELSVSSRPAAAPQLPPAPPARRATRAAPCPPPPRPRPAGSRVPPPQLRPPSAAARGRPPRPPARPP